MMKTFPPGSYAILADVRTTKLPSLLAEDARQQGQKQ